MARPRKVYSYDDVLDKINEHGIVIRRTRLSGFLNGYTTTKIRKVGRVKKKYVNSYPAILKEGKDFIRNRFGKVEINKAGYDKLMKFVNKKYADKIAELKKKKQSKKKVA